MSYLLFRVTDLDTDPDDGVYLGSFATFDAAIESRDDDAVALLAATADGEAMVACHQIVGTGADDEPFRHPAVSAVERRIQPEDPKADLVETRRWLAEIHRLSS